ncbi:MAG: alpha/beta fold hydrolase [Drouetiella hepatica Uher 2000/2452]|uniref:Alpha/beta fold hydrolase n=1 Tax=Drouetiella hepatica Uher 2000/2452 TaxID=904376 RepID=A0A951QEU7_9CYAN|nr:alpha/beta fold hydrolase [Drouetiella hepatica Uher 2000/2452]
MQLQQTRLGSQRDWIWRGWQVRYTFVRSATPTDQPPILFLHGFGSSLAQWQENLLPLSQTHPVYALDLVGFGASEKADTAYKVELWADQVYDFWRTFIGEPIVLVGHSLGALVALTAAVAYPEMVKNLALLTLPASRQELLIGSLQSWVGRIESFFTSPLVIRLLFQMVRRPGIIRAILKAAYVNPERITEELIASFLTPGFDRGASKAFYRLSKARTQIDFSLKTEDLLPQVTVPILVVWGEGDRVIPIVRGRQLSSFNSQLRLVEIPEAGHCLYDECAECVNAELLAWLGET